MKSSTALLAMGKLLTVEKQAATDSVKSDEEPRRECLPRYEFGGRRVTGQIPPERREGDPVDPV